MSCIDTDRETFVIVFYDCYEDDKVLCALSIIELVKHNKINRQYKELIGYPESFVK